MVGQVPIGIHTRPMLVTFTSDFASVMDIWLTAAAAVAHSERIAGHLGPELGLQVGVHRLELLDLVLGGTHLVVGC